MSYALPQHDAAQRNADAKYLRQEHGGVSCVLTLALISSQLRVDVESASSFLPVLSCRHGVMADLGSALLFVFLVPIQ